LNSLWIQLLSIFLTAICIISGIITFILNPGIIYNQKKEGIISENKIYCFQCKFQYPHLGKTLIHCDKCGVCYVDRDHHCDVFGKCVAQKNISVFSIFSISTCCFLMLNFFSLGYIMISSKK
jgi:hypothetical protein